MGKVTRKRYSADFKAIVALEAIRGEQTLAELAAKYGIHHTMIATWKRQAIEGMASTFSGKAEVATAADIDNQNDFVVPVELVSLTRRKTQWHEGSRHCGAAFLPPSLRITTNGIVATVITEAAKRLENPHQRFFLRWREHPTCVVLASFTSSSVTRLHVSQQEFRYTLWLMTGTFL